MPAASYCVSSRKSASGPNVAWLTVEVPSIAMVKLGLNPVVQLESREMDLACEIAFSAPETVKVLGEWVGICCVSAALSNSRVSR